MGAALPQFQSKRRPICNENQPNRPEHTFLDDQSSSKSDQNDVGFIKALFKGMEDDQIRQYLSQANGNAVEAITRIENDKQQEYAQAQLNV